MTIETIPGEPVNHKLQRLLAVAHVDPHRLIQLKALHIYSPGVRVDGQTHIPSLRVHRPK